MTQVSNVVNESSTIGEKGEVIRVSVSTEQSHQAIVEGNFSVFGDKRRNQRQNAQKMSFHPIIKKYICVHLGPESHSVHTMKSTKIVVEENSTCNDVEVDDLMKRAQKQRASLAEILTEKSIEKCEAQPEGTPKSPVNFFFHFNPLLLPITPPSPTPQWNENDRNIYYLSL